MNRMLLILAAALCLGLPARADTITFVNDVELAGPLVEIVGQTEEKIKVRVKYGTIMLLKERVKGVEIDYAQRWLRLTEENRETAFQLFELGRVCASFGLTDQAADAQLDAAEVPDDHHQNAVHALALDGGENGAPRGTARLAVVGKTILHADAIGPTVVGGISVGQLRQPGHGLGRRRHRHGADEKAAALLLELEGGLNGQGSDGLAHNHGSGYAATLLYFRDTITGCNVEAGRS